MARKEERGTLLPLPSRRGQVLRARNLLRAGRLRPQEARGRLARVAETCARCGWPPPRVWAPEDPGRRTSREFRDDGKEGRSEEELVSLRSAYRVSAPSEA